MVNKIVEKQVTLEKRLRKFILPNIFASVGSSCYTLADIFFISGAAGADGITAMNLVQPVFLVIYALGAMIGVGSVIRYSMKKSMSEPCDDYFSNAIFCALIGSIYSVCPE